MLNGFGYTMFNIPSRDLETTWRDVSDFGIVAESAPPTPQLPDIEQNEEAAVLSREISARRFATTRLYTGGRILHIVRRKRTELEKKSKTGGPTYEMRWSKPEDFTEFQIMPRMMLDHLPDNVFKTLTTILEEQKATKDLNLSLESL